MTETQPETFDGTQPGSRRSVTGTDEQPRSGTTAYPEREKPAQPLDLAEIEARMDAATPGPWESYVQCRCARDERASECSHRPYVWVLRVPATNWDGSYEAGLIHGVPGAATVEFIAHARTDIPALVAEVKRLRLELARTEGDLAVTVAEASRTREALREIAERGLNCDLTPTVMFGDESHVYRQLTRYLRDLDAELQRRADAALRGSADREGVG